MTTWLAVLGVGAGSLLLRVVPLSVVGRLGASERFDRLIRRAGVATLTALLVASIDHGARAGNDVALAGALVVALAVSVRGGSLLRVALLGGAMYALGIALLGLTPS